MRVISHLAVSNGLAAIVALNGESPAWEALPQAECAATPDGVVLTWGGHTMVLPMMLLECLLAPDGDPTLTVYPVDWERAVQKPVGSVVFRREALIEARGAVMFMQNNGRPLNSEAGHGEARG